ncbi:MAG: L,D-transpeptidase family protein, partial [Lentisphaeria bacterium]|nr:L,D-transpeptidase family protein [Lentisphaeria bacterium]
PDADPAGTASGPAADPQGRTGAAPGNTTPGGNDASVRRGAEAAAGYEKGRPGPQDPAPVNDKPLIPAEKSDAGDVDRRLKELTSALEKKDFAAVSSSAPEILSSLTPGSGPFRTVLRILTEANWARVISRDVSGGFAVMHTVRAGEFLGRIVRKNKTNVSLVMLVNKLKKSDIMVGQKLVLLPGPWKITVSKKRRQLELWRNGVIFMGFDVGIGRFGSTPSALFVVSDRLKHPVYRTRDGRVFQHGESGNELGDYFLKLAAAGTPDRPLLGYGIHGTPDESSVMRSLSSGCIRMRNAEVEKLYHIVPAGTPVEIGD